MKAIIRKDEQAVSPVIATILMVAITVVLAAVLYVMVSGLISGPGNAPKAIGVSVTSSPNGLNWVLTFTSVPSGLGLNTTTLTLTTSGGAGTNVTSAGLGTMITPAHGVQYYPTSASAVSAGDRLTIVKTAFGTGTGYSISASGSILASGTLS